MQRRFSKNGEKAQRLPLTDIDDNIIQTETSIAVTNSVNNDCLDNLRVYEIQ